MSHINTLSCLNPSRTGLSSSAVITNRAVRRYKSSDMRYEWLMTIPGQDSLRRQQTLRA